MTKATAAKETEKVGSQNLVGLFFVGDVGDRRGHQGHVLAYLVNGFYLVQFFSWVMGDPTHQGVVRLEDLLQAEFYTDHGQWIEAGENLTRRNMAKVKQ
jgi:hypothetical protein